LPANDDNLATTAGNISVQGGKQSPFFISEKKKKKKKKKKKIVAQKRKNHISSYDID
jgi:hypothetical protein